MDPVTIGLLAGVGLGLIKGQKNTAKNVQQDKYRKAAMLYSPWTGMGDVGGGQNPDMLESALSGAALGAQVGKGFTQSGQDKYYQALAEKEAAKNAAEATKTTGDTPAISQPNLTPIPDNKFTNDPTRIPASTQIPEALLSQDKWENYFNRIPASTQIPEALLSQDKWENYFKPKMNPWSYQYSSGTNYGK